MLNETPRCIECGEPTERVCECCDQPVCNDCTNTCELCGIEICYACHDLDHAGRVICINCQEYRSLR